jgi:ABC-type branched-subunit amino acid transport system substrate-binding protein
MPGLDPAAMAAAYGGRIFSVAPFAAGEGNVHYEKFAREFGRRFSSSPPPAAAYGFDAAQMIIDAIRERGLNRAGVREGLASLQGYVGATGPVAWDNGGGNSGTPVLKEYRGDAL